VTVGRLFSMRPGSAHRPAASPDLGKNGRSVCAFGNRGRHYFISPDPARGLRTMGEPTAHKTPMTGNVFGEADTNA
jgi:hypothetical protein